VARWDARLRNIEIVRLRRKNANLSWLRAFQNLNSHAGDAAVAGWNFDPTMSKAPGLRRTPAIGGSSAAGLFLGEFNARLLAGPLMQINDGWGQSGIEH